MRTRLCGVVYLMFVLCLAASPALADREVVVKPLDLTTPIPIGPGIGGESALQICSTGNLNPLVNAVVGFAAPPEEYKLVFDPQVGCSFCPVGFNINWIHIPLRTSQECVVELAVDVEDVSSIDPACPGRSPGAVVCNSSVHTVTVQAGVSDVRIPITCDCLNVNRLYLLSVHYVSSSCLTEPDLITDAFPTVCTSWNDSGAGWVDLVTTFGFPGNLGFWAEANCCEPVPTESKSWGAIKALYENF